ncbi:MAG: hypothetical protein KAH17_00885, partial [Bacteroidales bacterium]|nr:hypothetical protein [Bacteroidales bacterium]
NKVYFYTMEEGLYEVDVHSLEVNMLFEDGNMRTPRDIAGPLLPGYHGKGAYVSQNRLVVANNGEYYWQSTSESGSLSEWDGDDWKVIERKQFTEVTGPGGLYGNENSDDPIWSIGWDKKSLILKLRDGGEWFTYRLPKASFTYDGQHGWHTEWPRIRDIGQDKWLMTMHGMFWAFPPDFSRDQTSGIYPLSSYLKIIPDFAPWEGMLVMGCDDASMFDNALVGQPHSNFWFIKKDDLDGFGPKLGFGGPWIDDQVEAFHPSDPFLVSGFDRFMLYAEQDSEETIELLVERRKLGSNEWEKWKNISMASGLGINEYFSNTDQTEWIRFSTNKPVDQLTAVLHLSPDAYPQADEGIFEAIQPRGSSDIKLGWLRPSGTNGNLQIFSPGEDFADLDVSLDFLEGEMDEILTELRDNLIPKESVVSFDSASVVYADEQGQRWRLPFGYSGKKDAYRALNPRIIREVATERSLMNAGGLFYELPRGISGGISKVKPIATHNRMIVDFCSWRGLMAITGCNPRAKADEHYYVSGKKEIGLWLGAIDDLWKFGKPIGVGGPWKNTAVKTGEVSDPYLMYGFDEKSLELSHDGDEAVGFTILFDFVGEGEFKEWVSDQVRDDRIIVQPGEVLKIEFDEGFSAFWVKVQVDKGCRATAWFEYR